MPLTLRPSHEQFPSAGWPKSKHHLCANYGRLQVGSLFRIEGGPQNHNWHWSLCFEAFHGIGLTGPMQGIASTREKGHAALNQAWQHALTQLGLAEASHLTPNDEIAPAHV